MSAVVGPVVGATPNADLTARRQRLERARLAELVALRRAARAAAREEVTPWDRARPGDR